jgi:3-phosphoshikimate 1-carboxyvinyltransferase
MTVARAITPLAGGFDAVVRVPGSKSITNRAIVCAALADGTSSLEGALWADDTEAMAACLQALGVDVDVDVDSERIVVDGCGGALPAASARLDVLLSGTTARFIAPVVSTGHGRYEIDGGAPMRLRPMGPLIQALRALGVTVEETGEPGHLPLVVDADGVEGGLVALSADVSSQFLSGVLLAAPYFAKGVDVELTTGLVSAPYVELTRSVMRAFGVEPQGLVVAPGRYRSRTFSIEPDASTASYFFAAAVVSGGRVRIDGLGTTSSQGDLALVDVFASMGATVERDARSTAVACTGTLHGATVDLRHFSDMVPTLAVVAALADSPTTITGVGFIRGKESDRIDAVVTELQRCGIDAVADDDGMTIAPGMPHGAVIETYDDHRIAMAFSVLGLRVPGIEITDPGCVAKTFPKFFDTLDRLREAG